MHICEGGLAQNNVDPVLAVGPLAINRLGTRLEHGHHEHGGEKLHHYVHNTPHGPGHGNQQRLDGLEEVRLDLHRHPHQCIHSMGHVGNGEELENHDRTQDDGHLGPEDHLLRDLDVLLEVEHRQIVENHGVRVDLVGQRHGGAKGEGEDLGHGDEERDDGEDDLEWRHGAHLAVALACVVALQIPDIGGTVVAGADECGPVLVLDHAHVIHLALVVHLQ
mmetsp:Transcript_2621/g.7853  ORF Transcript_2621/g.7853 Transcript_2621/m.7853 type:complete len:220 (-) Transcript_2621:1605-2264(-)